LGLCSPAQKGVSVFQIKPGRAGFAGRIFWIVEKAQSAKTEREGIVFILSVSAEWVYCRNWASGQRIQLSWGEYCGLDSWLPGEQWTLANLVHVLGSLLSRPKYYVCFPNQTRESWLRRKDFLNRGESTIGEDWEGRGMSLSSQSPPIL
jgi:hypothetical protein